VHRRPEKQRVTTVLRLLVEGGLFTRGEFLEMVRVVDREKKKKVVA
jgi:hypothetical protein